MILYLVMMMMDDMEDGAPLKDVQAYLFLEAVP